MTKSYFPYNSKNKTRDKIQYHVRGGLGGMDDVFGGIDDALR